jgi:hypothetical protein
VTDRPIIFSAPMIRALLDGRKTQTRRVLCQHDPDRDPPSAGPYLAGHKAATWTDREGSAWRYPGAKGAATGDRLWVRETWSAIMNGGWTIADARRRMFDEKIVYRADGNGFEDGDGWWPSIHMPREFSRLTLTVTDVRVQRLQDISEEDAWAEGCKPGELNDRGEPFPAEEFDPHGAIGWDNARDWFADLWETLHGPDAWDANPWVVALTFTVRHGNIDAVPA